ncbi:MAG: helix-turn-helix domain-containing protein [Pseudomonadota bacterium]
MDSVDTGRHIDGARPVGAAVESTSQGASETRSRGVQSVQTGVRLLSILAAAGQPMSLRELSTSASMAPAKVHRYLASFVETGMVDHRGSGSYDLGPRAAEIGMAALQRVDIVNRASDRLPGLVEEVNATGMLTVWTANGPMVVRWERARVPMSGQIGVGSVLPLLRTATGRAFIAHMPDRVLADLVRSQLPHGQVDLAALRTQNTDGKVYFADELYQPGVFAIARPILNLHGSAEAVVALISNERSLLAPDGPGYKALLAF